MVAGAAAWPDRLWKFSVPISLILCRQRLADQSGGPALRSAIAQAGRWVPGPGAAFFHAIQKELGHLPFIAEDLGVITQDVVALRDQFQVPGTRVLQFAFDGHAGNPYLPKNFVANTVAYICTHDLHSCFHVHEVRRSRVAKKSCG